jgi:5-methylcytosine-specific restriction endonuclease McrA
MRPFPKHIEKIKFLHLTLLNSVNEKNYKPLGRVKETGLLLLLYSSNYKCEKCGSDKDLTIHHLIQKFVKNIVDKIKYVRQRHYFGNQVILCTRCHHIVHNFKPDGFTCTPIHKNKIERIKKRLEVVENE